MKKSWPGSCPAAGAGAGGDERVEDRGAGRASSAGSGLVRRRRRTRCQGSLQTSELGQASLELLAEAREVWLALRGLELHRLAGSEIRQSLEHVGHAIATDGRGRTVG